ncbi:MAG: conjugal transfer protein TraH, partial [Gammaproteobacteria bacterium]
MLIPYLRRCANVGLVVLGLLGSGQAFADPQQVMQNMFNTYTNVTPGGVYETQRRHGLTTGRVVARTPIVSPNFVNYSPPGFRAGCGGIDAWG